MNINCKAYFFLVNEFCWMLNIITVNFLCHRSDEKCPWYRSFLQNHSKFTEKKDKALMYFLSKQSHALSGIYAHIIDCELWKKKSSFLTLILYSFHNFHSNNLQHFINRILLCYVVDFFF